MAKREETAPVIIKIPQGTEKSAENLNVYVVDSQGSLIESHPLRGEEVRLKTSAQSLHGDAKLYIAPQLPQELQNVTVNEKALLNMGAWQPSLRLTDNNVFQIPYFPHFPFPLPFGFCNITGLVTKTFNVNGQPEVLPICGARVHICDVERIWIIINRIPDSVLNELRNRLIQVVKLPIPIPDPGPEETLNFEGAQVRSLALSSVSQTTLPNRPELPVNVQSAVLSGSIESFRSTLLNNFTVFHPYLCWWPWFWPWFYQCDEIATVTTDCNGRFNYNMLYFLKNHPNVYVWVEVLIGGVWVTVYRPWISCFTHWNYACGTDINISVTNPDVLPCFCNNPTIEDNHVWVKTVNWGTSIRSIQQFATSSGHLANAVGLTAYGGYGNISPFGSDFPFVLEFGDGFDAMGITHYRWSYVQKQDAYLTGVSDSKHILGGTLSRPYDHWIEVTPGDFENLPGSFALGPIMDPSNNAMYKIPHSDAPVDTGIAGSEWQSIYMDSVDIATGGWNPGLYEFTLELLDNNGNVVPLSASPFKVDRLPSDPPPPIAGINTINADGLAENYVIKDSSGNTIGFKFLMRVDNDYCYGGISNAYVAGTTTDTECGIGYYNDKNTDNADIYFQAGHPHNFATYSFAVYKGNSGQLLAAGSSGTSANDNHHYIVSSGNNLYDITPVSPITAVPPLAANLENPVSNMDQYHKSIPLSVMLGTCTIAAYSENLDVWATHTNGNTRLAYDASAVAAIAIAPKSEM